MTLWDRCRVAWFAVFHLRQRRLVRRRLRRLCSSWMASSTRLDEIIAVLKRVAATNAPVALSLADRVALEDAARILDGKASPSGIGKRDGI